MALPPPENINVPETVDEKQGDEIIADIPAVEEPKPRGRGRPKGSGGGNAPKKTAAKKAADAKALGKQIAGIHSLAAMATGLPELVISEEDGEKLAEAFQAVAEEYGLSLSGKTGAAVQLFAAAGVIYGPRIWRIKMRMDKQRQEATKNLEGDFNVPGNPAH